MSFGSGGFGGFGQQNQSSGFGFGASPANTNTTTGTFFSLLHHQSIATAYKRTRPPVLSSLCLTRTCFTLPPCASAVGYPMREPFFLHTSGLTGSVFFAIRFWIRRIYLWQQHWHRPLWQHWRLGFRFQPRYGLRTNTPRSSVSRHCLLLSSPSACILVPRCSSRSPLIFFHFFYSTAL